MKKKKQRNIKEKNITVPRYSGEGSFYRYSGEQRQRQEHPGVYTVDFTLSHVKWWGRGRREGNQVQQPAGPKERGVTKMAGLYREEQPSPWAGEVQGVGGVCQPEGPCNR